MPHRSGTLQLFIAMFLTRDWLLIVFSRVVPHDTNNSIAMAARMVAIFVCPRSNNSCRQVFVLAVANRCLRLMSTTRMVAVRRTGQQHHRM